MSKFSVLVTDDDKRILSFLRSLLKASGYEVFTATNGFEALEQYRAQEPDLIVLDLMMPEMDGLEMLKKLRSFSTVPVIILTAKGSDIDKIKGLQLGADDYILKPFNPDELLARIEAIKRRLEYSERRETTETFRLSGDINIDCKMHIVTVKGGQKYLTRIEWFLLNELVHHAGRIMTYEELLTRVWGPEYRDDIQILRTWISRLRYKLERESDIPALILTIPKVGYMINQASVLTDTGT